MKAILFVVLAVAALTLITTTITTPAFALKNFFNCITDAANKDGGDHNLTKQQVIDCFDKEFPNNPGARHFDKNLDSFSSSSEASASASVS